MGNCCYGCMRLIYRRKVLREYTALDAQPGEFDEDFGLIDDANGDGLLTSTSAQSNQSASVAPITENEKLLLKSKNYAALINSQKKFDDHIDKQLAAQEEKLKKEEDDLIRLRRSRNQASKPTQTSTQEDPWTTGDSQNWNMAGGEEDFDMFLDSIANRERNSNDNTEVEINEEDFVSGFSN